LDILLEVPLKRSDNNCMMNESEKRNWILEGTSELYWKYRDDLTDKGALQLEKALNKFEDELEVILKNEMTA
jgi:hypothetical protein